MELLVVGGVLIVCGIITSIFVLVNTLKYLQWQINFHKGQLDTLKKEKHELTLRVIQLEGKTNSHEIQINGVNFKSNINEINLKYLSKLLGK